MSEQDKKGILLESGTNEMEVVIFNIGEQEYGINVMKVREIILPQPITTIPNSHSFVEGIISVRGETLTVINLAKSLGLETSEKPEKNKLIITELNTLKVAFDVHDVTRIHRASWKDIEKPTKLSQDADGRTVGILKIDGKMVLLLDYERIITEINPEYGLTSKEIINENSGERSKKKIFIAEDSPLLRKILKETLESAGYNNLTIFEDGRTAWDELEKISKQEDDVKKYVNVLITDIEMPQMDGHHLTKKVKNDSKLKEIPTIIFSSLITKDLEHKGNEVGADAQISKPEIEQLISTLDRLTK